MPEPVPARPLAPDRRGPTEDNGLAVPPAHLHIALVVPDAATARRLTDSVRIVKPPLWNGKVNLHIIDQSRRKTYRDLDITVLQAMVDLGLITAGEAEIGPPESVTEGYPG